jgi:NCS1 family nucleobase:cation symporter-1
MTRSTTPPASRTEQVDRETMFGIVPLLKGERTFGFWDFFLVLSGYGIATWCYSQGAYIASLTGFKEMTVSIFAGNLLFITIICLMVPVVVRYGIDLWCSIRSLFGYRGVQVVCVLIVLVNFPWYAVASSIFASSLMELFAAFGLNLPAFFETVLALLCILAGTLIAIGGPVAIKWSTRIMVPLLILVGLVVIGIAFNAVPFSEILAYQPDSGMTERDSYAISIEGNIAFAMSWIAALGVMPRLAKRESHAFAGNVLAFGALVPLFLFAGGVMAIAMFVRTGEMTADPTAMLVNLASPVVGLLSLVCVGFANVTTQSVGSYSYAVALKSVFTKLDYRWLCWGLAVYTGVLAVWGGVEEHFGAFLSLAGLIYATFIGLVLTDFYLVRRQRFSLRSIYRLDDHNAYSYTGGFNVVAFVAMAAGIVVAVALYNPLTGEINSDLFYILGSSAFSCLATAVVYYGLSLIPAVGSYLLKDRDELTP